MAAEVKYLGDGTAVLTGGPGVQAQTSTDEGRTFTPKDTVRVLRLENPPSVEDVDPDALLDTQPDMHAGSQRPVSDTAPPEEQAAPAAPAESYTDNGDGTWVRDSDGVHGTFGPSGFTPTA